MYKFVLDASQVSNWVAYDGSFTFGGLLDSFGVPGNITWNPAPTGAILDHCLSTGSPANALWAMTSMRVVEYRIGCSSRNNGHSL